jgi:trans-2,3-dihydro-3-hydroxyanthranilate isomerase
VRLAYEVVDVFTDRAYAGNPLAVVFGADDLGTEQCQAIATEFHLSETAFPMATTRPADYRLRIFTPAAELPFAGHPSVGAGWVQRRRGVVTADRWVQDCGAGLLPLSLRPDGTIELTGGTPEVGDPLDPAPLLAAVGLDTSASAGAARYASTGAGYTVLPVTAEALSAAEPLSTVAAALVGTGGHALYLLAWSGGGARVRLFAPGLGITEDPATGSAATALGAYLAAEGLVPDGETRYVVSQGTEIGRPSTLYATVVVAGGAATECRVAGHVVPVASGEIEVPPR